MKTYKSFIKLALKDKRTVSVWDGDEWAVRRSGDYSDIIEAIESVEEAEIKIRNDAGEYLGWALIIPSLGNEEDIADYSDNIFMNELWGSWENQ